MMVAEVLGSPTVASAASRPTPSPDFSLYALPQIANSFHERVLAQFGGENGGAASAGPIIGGSGDLYGTTGNGGASGNGVVYEVHQRNGHEDVLYNFGGYPDGSNPIAGLIEDPDGAFYGTTQSGGGCYGFCGTVYRLARSGSSWSETVLYSFQGPPDGRNPHGALIEDKAGALYGTTSGGGQFDSGTVFKLTPTASGYTESILYSFYGGADGGEPDSALIADANGTLYGTTYLAGAYERGVVFALTPSASGYRESVVYAFQCCSDGLHPNASLVEDRHGALFGTTVYGGSSSGDGLGTVFELIPNKSTYTERIVHRFLGAPDGALPFGPLFIVRDGVLAGTTDEGGTFFDGTFFELSFSGRQSEESIYSFDGTDGLNPGSGLVSDGRRLYGATSTDAFQITPQ
jgi:uncharacterized repeat protein (TIGR03803 family)